MFCLNQPMCRCLLLSAAISTAITTVGTAQNRGAQNQGANLNSLFTLPRTTDPEELVGFINSVLDFVPQTKQEQVAYSSKAPEAIKLAAETILEIEPDPTSEFHQFAANYRLAMRVMTVDEEDRVGQEEIVVAVARRLAAKELDSDAVELAVAVADGLADIGERELSIRAFTAYAKLLRRKKMPELNELATFMEGAARRLGVVGKPISVTGTTVDGQPFDWERYRGKVVLVDFWATWCAPCRAELPNVIANYEAFKDRGFEVVGISVDQKRVDLEKFLAANPLDWVTLHEADGGINPTAGHYSIRAVPTTILVDQVGKVVSLNARGPQLGKLLGELLGPASRTARR